MKNLRALIKVETYFTLRNWQSLVMAIGMPLAFYLLFSGIYQAEMPYSYRVFMMISMTASSLLSFNVFALPYNLTADKHNNWRRFLHHSPVSVVQYYLVKALRFVLLYSLAIGVVFSFGGLVRQITLPAYSLGRDDSILIYWGSHFLLAKRRNHLHGWEHRLYGYVTLRWPLDASDVFPSMDAKPSQMDS